LKCGRQLARAMLRIFDPTVNAEKEPDTDIKLAPLYRNAKVVGGILPGELFLLLVLKKCFSFLC